MSQNATLASSDIIALTALGTSRERAERPGPKWRQLADAFSEGIVSGRFMPGQRIPAETSLAAMLGVSVGTVRRAFDDLAASGLIVRYRKSGSFIADRSSQASEVFVYRFKDPQTGATALPFVRTLAVEKDRSEGPWTAFMGEGGLVRVDRLVWFENEPPAFSSVYFHPTHGRQMLKRPVEELNSASLHRMLIDRFNLPTLRMEHSIAARALPAMVCERLALPSGAIGTVWDIRDYTVADRPVLYQRYHLPPGHRAIEIDESCGGGMPSPSRRPAFTTTTKERKQTS